MVKASQRRRILAAALEQFGRHGFAATSIQALIRDAQVSRATFYGLFDDKEACLVALYEEGVTWLQAEAATAIARGESWPRAVNTWVVRVVELLSEDRRLARVCTVEASMGGDGVGARQLEVVAGLAAALREGRRERRWGADLPQVLEELIVRGAIGVLAGRLVHQPGEVSRGLADELAEILLTPYLGATAAKSVVRDP